METCVRAWGEGATLAFRVIGEELATYIMYEKLSSGSSQD
jgi:hypothetical protein